MITISNLSNKKNGRTYTYSDFSLDFEEKQVSSNSRNSNVSTGNDIVVLSDVDAIKTAIRNILFQTRHLTPTMDVRLNKYIGLPLTEMRGISIGEDIERAIALFEPRVSVKKIYVGTDYDAMSYYIQLVLDLVSFDQSTIILNARFTNDGQFDFLNI